MGLRRRFLLLLLTASLPFLLTAGPFVEKLNTGESKSMALSVHMANDQVVVVTFTDAFEPERLKPNPLTTKPEEWRINGKQPVALYHAAGAVDELAKRKNGTYPVETRYKLYLDMGYRLENNTQYTVQGPFGTVSFVFNDKSMLNESFKVNQVGYHPDSSVRYANLGIFLGDGGSRRVAEDLAYQVLD
jgi:hypothetical protein